MFKVNNKDTITTRNFEHVIAGWVTGTYSGPYQTFSC